MIGIIYKFTILINKKFYVGQYSGNKFYLYWGSGSIWNDYLSSLKKKYPNCWKRLVKREILWQGECNQKMLNKLEEVYIRRERSHYSKGLGGCNILQGSANEYNPAKNIITRNKMSQRKKELFSSERGILTRKKMSQHHANVKGKNNPCFGTMWITNGEKSKRIFLHEEIPDGWFRGNNKVSNKNNPMYGKTGEKHPCFGKKRTKEQIEKMRGKNNPMYGKPSPMRGKKMSEESKQKMSESAKRRMSIPENNPMYSKVRITNGVENRIIDSNSLIPDGWRRGITRKNSDEND